MNASNNCYSDFKISIVEDNIDNALLAEREIYYINYYNTTDPRIGYNISPGGYRPPSSEGKPTSVLQKLKSSQRTKGTK